jgi:hypothetical protein
MTDRANRSGYAWGWLARLCAYGAALGVGSFLLFLGSIGALGAFHGYGGLILGPALLYGLPIAAVVGALCAVPLRRRDHPLRRAVWLVPLITVPLTLVLGIATVYAKKALQEKLEQAHTLRTVTANYSGHWIRDAKLFNSDCRWDYMEGDDLAPEAAGGSMPLKIEREGSVTPAWDAHRTVTLSWFRPLHGAHFDDLNFEAPTALVHAEVSLPPYRGTINKVFVIVFLPDDKVRVEAVAASGFDGKVPKPSEDRYVTQGTAQTCEGNCCPQ